MPSSQLANDCKALLDELPDSEMEILSLARSLERQGRTESACLLLREAFDKCPSLALSKSLAALHLRHGHFERSIQAILEFAGDRLTDIPSALLLAEAHIHGGQHRRAFELLKQAQKLGASSQRIQKLTQILDASRSNEPESTPAATTEHSATAPDAETGLYRPPDTDQTRPEQTIPEQTSPDDQTLPTPQKAPQDAAPESSDAEPGPAKHGPSSSVIFEDSTFSNLNSLELAAGSAGQVGSDGSGMFDTLIDAPRDELSSHADRSFDELLVDLGVPIEADSPDATASRIIQSDDGVAAEWGLESPPADASTDRRSDEPIPAPHPEDTDDGFAAVSTPPIAAPPTRDGQHVDEPNADEQPSPDSSETTMLSKRSKPATPNDDAGDGAAPFDPVAGKDEAISGAPDRRSLPPSPPQRPTHSPTASAVPEGSVPTQPRQPTPGDDVHPDRPGPKDKVSRRKTIAIVAALSLVFLASTAVAAVAAISTFSADAISHKISAAHAASQSDTYRGYLVAESKLGEAITAHGFAGETIENALSRVGLTAGAAAARVQARAELARISAMIEYRYESPGTHRATEHIAEAKAHDASGSRLDVGRAYHLMARGRATAAVELLEATHRADPDFTEALTALIRARLDLHQDKAASKYADALRRRDDLGVHQQYTLALVDQRLGTGQADAQYANILDSRSPDHLSARIQRSFTVREADPDKFSKASALLNDVLERDRDLAAPAQLARAHIARGQLNADRDADGQAEEQFRKAIKAAPKRPAVYVPLIDLYLRESRLDQALDLVDKTSANGWTGPDLVVRRAQILRRTGQTDAAISVVDEANSPGARGWLVKGKTLLDVDRIDDANEAFDRALSADPQLGAARAYKQLVDVMLAETWADDLPDGFEHLVTAFDQDPDVLRAAAVAAMYLARRSDSRTRRRRLLERAHRLLQRAVSSGGDPAQLNFALCHQQMLTGHGSRAAAHCRKGLRANRRYLPGLLTMADLQLRRGRADDVVDTLGHLDAALDGSPRVDQSLALAYLDRHQIDKAAQRIDRWAATPTADTPGHLFVEGRILFARHQYSAAVGYFERARQRGGLPSQPLAVYLAQTLARLGQFDSAEAQIRPELTDLAFEPQAWLVFGELRRRQQHFGDARENLGLAVKKLADAIAPPWRMSQAYTQLALTWAGRYGWSHRYVARYLSRGAKRGDADFPALNAARGRYYLGKRRPDKHLAVDAFERVIDVTSYACSTLERLAELYDDLGESAKAERVAQRAGKHCKD